MKRYTRRVAGIIGAVFLGSVFTMQAMETQSLLPNNDSATLLEKGEPSKSENKSGWNRFLRPLKHGIPLFVSAAAVFSSGWDIYYGKRLLNGGYEMWDSIQKKIDENGLFKDIWEELEKKDHKYFEKAERIKDGAWTGWHLLIADNALALATCGCMCYVVWDRYKLYKECNALKVELEKLQGTTQDPESLSSGYGAIDNVPGSDQWSPETQKLMRDLTAT